MKDRYLLVGSLLNLVTLVVGIGIGLALGAYSGRAHAQGQPRIQPITPVIAAGSFASPLILAHEIQSDMLVVNGFDVLKLQQGVLDYLARQPGADAAALRAVVNGARASQLYTVKAPPTPPQSPKERKQ